MVRTCTKCKITKEASCFHKKNTRSPDGLMSACKDCRKITSKIFYIKNKEKILEYQRNYTKDNKELLAKKSKIWRTENAEYIRQKGKKYNEENKEEITRKRKLYYQTSKGIQARRKQRRERYLKDAKYKLNRRISGGIRKSIHGKKAGRTWESLVGYSLQELMVHLEEQFQPGMSWENLGEWHIDHITPLMVHNFKKPEDTDFKKAWALKNLQPLWAKDNLTKNNKLDQPFQPSLTL